MATVVRRPPERVPPIPPTSATARPARPARTTRTPASATRTVVALPCPRKPECGALHSIRKRVRSLRRPSHYHVHNFYTNNLSHSEKRKPLDNIKGAAVHIFAFGRTAISAGEGLGENAAHGGGRWSGAEQPEWSTGCRGSRRRRFIYSATAAKYSCICGCADGEAASCRYWGMSRSGGENGGVRGMSHAQAACSGCGHACPRTLQRQPAHTMRET